MSRAIVRAKRSSRSSMLSIRRSIVETNSSIPKVYIGLFFLFARYHAVRAARPKYTSFREPSLRIPISTTLIASLATTS